MIFPLSIYNQSWTFTNSTGSMLMHYVDRHVEIAGVQTNFGGWDAYIQSTTNSKQVMFTDWTSEEIEELNIQLPVYSVFSYNAKTSEDKKDLERAINSYVIYYGKSNKPIQATPIPKENTGNIRLQSTTHCGMMYCNTKGEG